MYRRFFSSCEYLNLRSTSWRLLKYWRPVKWLKPLFFSLHVPDTEALPWASNTKVQTLPASNTKAKPSAYCWGKPCSSSNQEEKEVLLKLPLGKLPNPVKESESLRVTFSDRKKDFFPLFFIFILRRYLITSIKESYVIHTQTNVCELQWQCTPQHWKIKLPLAQEIPWQQLKI